MDIKIEAIQHQNQEQLRDYYEGKLQEKYGNYDFIKSIDVKVVNEKNDMRRVSLQIKPEKGTMLYATHSAINENKALTEVIRKMNTQIEKYKEVHYHGRSKNSIKNQ